MEKSLPPFTITPPDPVDQVIHRVRFTKSTDRYAHELLQVRRGIQLRREHLLKVGEDPRQAIRFEAEIAVLRAWLRAGLNRPDWVHALGLSTHRLLWETGHPMDPNASWEDAVTQGLYAIDLYGDMPPLEPGTRPSQRCAGAPKDPRGAGGSA